MLEAGPGDSASPPLPQRQVFASQAASLGISLALERQDELPWMDIRFAELRRFEARGFKM
jgi:hypothetical protein